MSRFVSHAVTFSTAALLTVGAAQAAPRGYYVAAPIATSSSATFVTRTVAWSCDADRCVAPKAPERAMIVCQQVAGKLGALRRFSVGEAAFDADALAECNAHAK